MGLNVRRDPLCLIQISSGNSDAHIVQFNRENYNAPNLVKILSDENITKIFHYGRADIAHIKYYLKVETKNILDTKIASRLARSYSDNHSLMGCKTFGPERPRNTSAPSITSSNARLSVFWA